MSGPRIGINLLWLRPGEVGGTETYIRRILESLASDEEALDVHLFGTTSAIEAVRPEPTSIIEHRAPSGFEAPPLRVILERTWLRRSMSRGIDVAHHPGGTVPFTGSPSVVTIHDLQPLDHPSNFSAVKRAFLARAIPTAIDRADVVITPSDWVGEQVRERFSLGPDRVVTVSAFAQARVGVGHEPTARVSDIVSRGPVALYPAMTMNHKNHACLFDAFSDAVLERPDLQLVCVGAVGRDDQEIRAKAAATSAKIRMLGHVTRGDLDFLLASAEVLVFPSRYEGFGLPVLEAQQAGLPVVASTAGALPEVAGLGAVLLDPQDRTAWTQALVSPLEGPARITAVEVGRANAARYSVESTGIQQRSAYERAAT